MRNAFLLPLLLLMSACTVPNIPINGPAPIAEATTLDEKTGILATNAYTAVTTLGYRLAALGVIDKEKYKAADKIGIEAVRAIRTAYLAGNSASYAEAIARTYEAIDRIKGLAT